MTFECQLQYLERIYAKISLAVYLTFQFNWAVCVFICSIWQPYSQCFSGESRLADGKTEALGQGRSHARQERTES